MVDSVFNVNDEDYIKYLWSNDEVDILFIFKSFLWEISILICVSEIVCEIQIFLISFLRKTTGERMKVVYLC